MKKNFTLVFAVLFLNFVQAQVVIYEVYGGGGGTAVGPPFSNDYIVLLNKGTSAVDLTGWSVQYASVTGPSTGSWAKVQITAGSIAAKKFFLVKMSPDQSTAAGNPQFAGIILPSPDFSLTTSATTGGLTMAASGGKVAIVNDNNALLLSNPSSANIVDLVGWGANTAIPPVAANYGEGGTIGPVTTSTKSIRRINNGQDTNNNADDFAINLTPTPLNSSSPALPIELTTFNAKSNNSTTKLLWQTASEKNNSHFAIERSNDGEAFSKMGEVKGNGTSLTTRDYQFTDATPYKGINYYRLRQVDFDGTENFSKVVSVSFDGKGQNKFKVYPTLVKDNITVEIDEAAKSEISVRDLTGRVILVKNISNPATGGTEGVSAQTLNLSTLSSGLYILSVRSNESFESVKIYKQ
jgi:Lamin Tail Domain/Secretion system C-terminal sorting domain